MADLAKMRMKKRHMMCCCVLLVVLAFVAVGAALFFTVFRARAPRVVATPVDVRIEHFSVLPPMLNISIGADVLVNNPNNAKFRYGGTTTAVMYHGDAVGQSPLLGGEIGARQTDLIGTRVELDALRVAGNALFAGDVLTGMLPLRTATVVDGKAVALGVFKVRARSEVACSVNVYVFTRQSSSQCTSTIHVG